MRWLPWLVSICVAGFFVWASSSGIDADKFRTIFANIQPQWIAGAVMAFASGLFLRALRWRELIAPLRPLNWRAMLRPTLVGFALNAIFPARLGEFFRANYARHYLGVPGATLLGTIIIERVADLTIILIILIVGSGLAAGSNLILMPWDLIGAGIGGLVFAVIGFTFLILKLPRVFNSRINMTLIAFFRRLHEGLAAAIQCNLRSIGFVTLAIWSAEALSVWFLFRVCGVEPSLGTVMLALSCGALSTLLPNAPGYIGALQFGMFAGVELSGGDGSVGVTVATLVQIFLYFPAMLVGMLWLARSPMAALRIDSSERDCATSPS